VLISHVVPPAHLYLSDLGDYDFCLAHLALKDANYKQFFIDRKKQGRTVYMDNGVWERGVPIESEQMIELALEIQPDYVYAPDYMNDMYKTILSVGFFGRKANRTPGFTSKIIGVAQGSNFKEWFICVGRLARFPANVCDTIAINTLLFPDLYAEEEHEGARRTKARLKLLHQIDQVHESLSHKRFYATGFGATIDAKELLQFPWLTSVDTAIACIMASQGIEITEENSTYFKPKGIIDNIVFEDDSLATRNMDILNTWIKGGDPFAILV